MENLKLNDKRAKNAIKLLWLLFALEIISLISGYFQYNLIKSSANGIEISIETANLNDRRELIIGIIYMIFYIISIITFIKWFRRAYYNLHLRVDQLSETEGWAAGCWFVPIINFFKPYQIMKELYLESKKLLIEKGFSINENFTTKTINWWWTFWIIHILINKTAFRMSLRAESISELTNTTITSMIGNGIGIPLALITIKVIKDYSKVEPLLLEIKDEEKIINSQV